MIPKLLLFGCECKITKIYYIDDQIAWDWYYIVQHLMKITATLLYIQTNVCTALNSVVFQVDSLHCCGVILLHRTFSFEKKCILYCRIGVTPI